MACDVLVDIASGFASWLECAIGVDGPGPPLSAALVDMVYETTLAGDLEGRCSDVLAGCGIRDAGRYTVAL